MSSTNRGAERSIADYYYTPIPTIQDFWKKFCEVEGKIINDFSTILDPCAGGDKNRPCAYPTALIQFDGEPDDQIANSRFWTVDIREDSKADYKENYLEHSYGTHPLIISNPPFSLFEDFVRKGMDEVEDGGYVIFLQRLNVVGGQDRQEQFWKHYKPKSIYTHVIRPNFQKGLKVEKIVNGVPKLVPLSGDSCEYAHFVWQKGWVGGTSFYWV